MKTAEDVFMWLRNLRSDLNNDEIDIYEFYERICELID